MTVDGPGLPTERNLGLLVVEDDHNLCGALHRAFQKRGYAVKSAGSVPQALALLNDWSANYAVIDLRLPGPSGLTLIPPLKEVNAEMRIVMMTGYGSIATAVEAIKLGAVHYLAKPVDMDMIERAFHLVQGDVTLNPQPQRLSVNRLAWEHIHGALNDYGGNISAAARALGMHRRTLQRKLGKRPARA
ncbi:MAG: response regulator transcription factor [Burkholderiales bacterium]